MFAAYVDESANERFYFFGALIVNNSHTREIERGMREIAKDLAVAQTDFDVSTEFHGYNMFQGTEGWKNVPTRLLVNVCERVVSLVARSEARFVFLGVDRDAHQRKYGQNAYPIHELTMAHVMQSIDEVMTQDRRNPDSLVLVLADEHHTKEHSRSKLTHFKYGGPTSGWVSRPIERISDTIYFGPSDMSYLLQACDVVTFFAQRRHCYPQETDPRAERAMSRISQDISRITVKRFIWAPAQR